MQNVDIVDVSGAEPQLADLDDGVLLSMARSGHQDAYATLFARYSYAAHRLARHLGQKEDSDDVVSEAFAQVLDLLGRGKGPERAFRAYLFTTVRHECARRAKARQRVVPTDDLQQIDTPVAFGNGQLDSFERSAIRSAYESLPPRWRTVLWHLDVEGRKPHELGPLLELSPNSVSALVYRARAGLREAYLQQHVRDEDPSDSTSCREHRTKMSGFVRGTASARDQERIHAHLESCTACMAVYLDLQEVNREVGSIRLPFAAAVAAIGVVAASVLTNVLVAGKAIAATVLPPVAAAALASATLVAPPAVTVADQPRVAVLGSATPEPATPRVPTQTAPVEVSRSSDRPSVADLPVPAARPAATRTEAVAAPSVEPAAPSVPAAAPAPTTAASPVTATGDLAAGLVDLGQLRATASALLPGLLPAPSGQ